MLPQYHFPLVTFFSFFYKKKTLNHPHMILRHLVSKKATFFGQYGFWPHLSSLYPFIFDGNTSAYNLLSLLSFRGKTHLQITSNGFCFDTYCTIHTILRTTIHTEAATWIFKQVSPFFYNKKSTRKKTYWFFMLELIYVFF